MPSETTAIENEATSPLAAVAGPQISAGLTCLQTLPAISLSSGPVLSASIKGLTPDRNGWMRFDLNVGGFIIKNCRWKPSTGAIAFPQRRTRRGTWKGVVYAPGIYVMQLHLLLGSGQVKTPRDRTACTLKIHNLKAVAGGWYVFGFTVRGITIWGCRWHPFQRSIQLPISYAGLMNSKRRVVNAPGAHVNRLRKALVGEARNRGISCIP
jgi:hypothetical protein